MKPSRVFMDVLAVLVTATTVGMLTVVCIAAIDGSKDTWKLASWFWWNLAIRVYAVAVLVSVFRALAVFTVGAFLYGRRRRRK